MGDNALGHLQDQPRQGNGGAAPSRGSARRKESKTPRGKNNRGEQEILCIEEILHSGRVASPRRRVLVAKSCWRGSGGDLARATATARWPCQGGTAPSAGAAHGLRRSSSQKCRSCLKAPRLALNLHLLFQAFNCEIFCVRFVRVIMGQKMVIK